VKVLDLTGGCWTEGTGSLIGGRHSVFLRYARAVTAAAGCLARVQKQARTDRGQFQSACAWHVPAHSPWDKCADSAAKPATPRTRPVLAHSSALPRLPRRLRESARARGELTPSHALQLAARSLQGECQEAMLPAHGAGSQSKAPLHTCPAGRPHPAASALAASGLAHWGWRFASQTALAKEIGGGG